MIESLRLSETDNILQKRLFSLSINIILVNGNEAGKLTQNFLPLFMSTNVVRKPSLLSGTVISEDG